MKLLVVIAVLVVSCAAAPSTPKTLYSRPSPINPSVVSESKPADKTTVINKYKRETSKPFYPTVLPEEVVHQINKRDHKPGHDSHTVSKPKAPEPPKKSAPPQPPKKSALKHQPSPPQRLPVTKRNRRNAPTASQKDDGAAVVLQKPQTLPAVIHNDAHKDHVASIALQKPQTLPAVVHNDGPKDDSKTQHQKPLLNHHGHNVPAIALQKPQTLPAIVHEDNSKDTKKPTANTSQQHKRDIPVPLVAQKKTADVPSKSSSSEEQSHEHKNIEQKDNKEAHKQVATPHTENVQVEDLSEPKPVGKHTPSTPKHPHEFHPQHGHVETKHPISEEHKPAILGDIQQKPIANKAAAPEITTSTNDHPVIRPKPVPVAELFSRHHDN